MDKAMIDMTGRLWSPAICRLLVGLLNDNNTEVEEAHASQAGKDMMDAIFHPQVEDSDDALNMTFQDGQVLAGNAEELMDLDPQTVNAINTDINSTAYRRSQRQKMVP